MEKKNKSGGDGHDLVKVSGDESWRQIDMRKSENESICREVYERVREGCQEPIE